MVTRHIEERIPGPSEIGEDREARIALRLVRIAADVLAHEGELKRIDRGWAERHLRYPDYPRQTAASSEDER
jgi:hypothetical protein